ncbi:FAD-binding PCMH-type domain-containing protein [Aphelenchoides bicaudatus]|nr:FAD-binding PCMH-type domain-containing protein [Aphelenchoides bicaudatus]
MSDYYSQNYYGQNQPPDQTNQWFQQDANGWAQTDYSQQQQQYNDQSYSTNYGDQSQYGGNSQQQNYYGGNMFIPSAPQKDFASGSGGDDFENEPPLLEELGINFNHIRSKTFAVLNPISNTTVEVASDQDLAGPLAFCLLLGASLLLNGRVYFGYIYGIGMLGCFGMYALLNLMSEQKSISFTCTASVLGYCLLPMSLLALSATLLSFSTYVGYAAAAIVIAWCSTSSSKLFSVILGMEGQKLLVAYPCSILPSLPDLVLRPSATDEVSALLRLCNENRLPVTAFGTGTGIEGASVPIYNGIVVDMQRMDRVLELNEADFDCWVQPGVTRKHLNEVIRDTGLFFSVDPGADASICGMIATSASGTTSVRYGTMKQNTKNLEVVLADGRLIHTKGKDRRPWKSSSGLNITELFIGSEGTLGLITKACVSLHPRPQAVSAAVCSFPNVMHAVEAVVALRQMALPLSRTGKKKHLIAFEFNQFLEFLDERQMKACIEYSHLDMPAKPTLFLEFHGATDEEVATQAKTAEEACASNNGGQFQWALHPERINDLWKARHTAYYACLAQKPGSKGLVYRCLRAFESGSIVGHVGEGNFHCLFPCHEDDKEEMKRIWEFSDQLVKIALAAGGTCTGEHGVGLGKRQYLKEEFGETTLNLMRTLKQTLDPNGILNPGKIFLD